MQRLHGQACPSAVLSCKHTPSSSVFSHCLRVVRQKKQTTANTKFNKTSLFSWTSVSEDIIIHTSLSCHRTSATATTGDVLGRWTSSGLCRGHMTHSYAGWKHEAGRRFHYRKVYYIFNELHSFIKQLLTLTWHKPNQTPLQLVKVSNVVNQAVHGRHTCSCKPHWGGFARHVSLWCWWLVACIHSPLLLANVA